MRKQNAFLQKQETIRKVSWDNGCEAGFQMCLRDPEIMGGDIFGKDRYEREYGDAWMDEVESDVLKEKIDAILREVHGDDLVPFMERNSMVTRTNYSHGKKRWRE